MATSAIMNPNSAAVAQNLKSITRVVASGATGYIGNIIFYVISNVIYPKTVSSIGFSGNELMFVVDLTSTHQAGTIVLMEFNDTSIRLS